MWNYTLLLIYISIFVDFYQNYELVVIFIIVIDYMDITQMYRQFFQWNIQLEVSNCDQLSQVVVLYYTVLKMMYKNKKCFYC